MLKKTLLLSTVLALGSCASLLDDQIQDVKFTTPGAENAVCHVYIDKIHYVVRPPQTINVAKSRHNMEVDCLAPGNRRQKIYIEPGYQKAVGWNALNAGAGVAYDYASNAMFRFPDEIQISFVDVPIRDQPLPAQNRPDVRQPETYLLEEFLPSTPRMNADAYEPDYKLLRRGEGEQYYDGNATMNDDGTDAFSEPAQITGGKGDLKPVPSSTSDAGVPPVSSGEPVPLLPGE